MTGIDEFLTVEDFIPYLCPLTSMSLRDFPLLKDMNGGTLKICCREGWFCIKCHFSNKIYLRFGQNFRTGPYFVMYTPFVLEEQ